ncbi:ankyrin repeat domain-containing protein [Gluconacetobacter tumulisoli]|uniref:Ankyrin repeat domain-containing protein n=1 Tax=Gluconacetobacter tumulisoli TaxID=1286189 RepID=A0A7W4PP54_9PROT|nr:ankyrin repeat domain-containing protein [Gluconacetobacter tumulisoli]MBB2201476.1 ankyrin repeat domain-containing protein [Gluconacetobacter tumulisoli]
MSEISVTDTTANDAPLPGGQDRSGQDNDPAAAFTETEIACLFLDAARDGQTDLVEGFLAAGMDPDLRDGRGYSALILAAYNSHDETVACLLAHHAAVDLQDAKGATALAGVAFKGDLAVARLLVAAGAGIDVPNHVGRTPLIFATMFNRAPMVAFLLEHGADPDRRDGEGNSARLVADRQGLAAIAALMPPRGPLDAPRHPH